MAQEKKSALYLFSQFVNELRETNAEIYYKGDTYSNKNRKYTVKQLLHRICDFDSPSKVDTITRDSYLTDKHTRDGSYHKTHENVLNQLAFFFKENTRKGLTNKTEFYIEREGNIGHLYKNLSLNVNERLIDHFKQPNIDGIFKYISNFNLNSKTINKLQSEEFLQHKTLKKQVQESFNKIAANYCQVLVSENRINNFEMFGYIIPEYDLGFSRAYSHSIEKEITMNSKALHKGENKFDKLRYKRIRLVREKYLKNSISEWPAKFITHLFIKKLEEICIVQTLLRIVTEEIKYHLNFALYTSSDGKTIKLQRESNDWEFIADYLSNYRFPDKFKNCIQIKRDTILEGNFMKHPDKLASKNKHTVLDIKPALFEALLTHFFKILCKETGLNVSQHGGYLQYFKRLKRNQHMFEYYEI